MRTATYFKLLVAFVGFVVLPFVFLYLHSVEKSCLWWKNIFLCLVQDSFPITEDALPTNETIIPSTSPLQQDLFPITEDALPTNETIIPSTSPSTPTPVPSNSTPSCLCSTEQFTRLNLAEFKQTFGQPPQELTNSFATDYILDKYTVLIPTYKRSTGLINILRHYCNAMNVHKVLFIWHNVGESVPGFLTDYTNCQVPFNFLIPGHNLLSDRFKLTPEIETEAVFTLDDDTIVPYAGLQLGFRTWQAYKHLIVGFLGRRHNLTNGHYKYRTDQVEQQCYSIVLTGLSFLHRKYLEMYFAEPARRIFDYVDKFMNGEDLMMNAVISNYLSQFDFNFPCHGVLVSGRRKEVKRHDPEYKGLWYKPSHWKERNDCLDLIAEVYGRLPFQCCHYSIMH